MTSMLGFAESGAEKDRRRRLSHDSAGSRRELELQSDSGFLPAAVTAALERGLVFLPEGEVEEHWEFEADAYSIGILAILTKGLPSALPHLGLALFTPLVQTAILFLVFQNLVSQPREPDGESASVNGYVTVICFILMALQLSNEALEGMWKLTFCMRASSGVYADLKGPAVVATILAFLQFIIAVFTVGCSMLVVCQQNSALDAFMNFVALAFLTEIDNILISSRTVRNFVEVEHEIQVRHARKANHDEKTPWTVGMAVCTDALVMIGLCVSQHARDTAAEALGGVQDPGGQIEGPLSALVALLVLNIAMWVGSRGITTLRCGALLAILCIAFVAVDTRFLYVNHFRMTPFLMPVVPFWFAMLAMVSGNAVVQNPFPLLRCPFSTPSLVWTMLVIAVFQVQAMYDFGVH